MTLRHKEQCIMNHNASRLPENLISGLACADNLPLATLGAFFWFPTNFKVKTPEKPLLIIKVIIGKVSWYLMRNAFFLNPSPGNLFCHLNVVPVFDVFVLPTSAQTFFFSLCSRFVYSSNSLRLLFKWTQKREEKWRLSLSLLPCTNQGKFYRNTTQSEEPEKPFSTQTDIKRI